MQEADYKHFLLFQIIYIWS